MAQREALLETPHWNWLFCNSQINNWILPGFCRLNRPPHLVNMKSTRSYWICKMRIWTHWFVKLTKNLYEKRGHHLLMSSPFHTVVWHNVTKTFAVQQVCCTVTDDRSKSETGQHMKIWIFYLNGKCMNIKTINGFKMSIFVNKCRITLFPYTIIVNRDSKVYFF